MGIASIGGSASNLYVENKGSIKGMFSVMGGTGTTVVGGVGADTFALNVSADSVVGGKGNDSYYVAGDNITAVLTDTAGSDAYSIKGANAKITIADDAKDGSTADKVVIGGEKANVQASGTNGMSYEVLKDAEGATVVAGDGADTVKVNASKAEVNVGAGNDSVSVADSLTATITAGAGADNIFIGKAATVTLEDLSLADKDVLTLGYGSASDTANSYTEANGYTQISLKGGTELNLKGTMAELKSVSIGGNKTVKDLFADSVLPAADTVSADKVVELDKFSSDSVYAYVGLDDSVAYTGATDGVSVIGTAKDNNYIAEPNGKGQAIDGSKAKGKWSVTGTFNSDSIVGSAQADTIKGNGGKDTIEAGAGNDSIYVTGGEAINTGDGTDTIDVTALGANAATITAMSTDKDVVLVNNITDVDVLSNGAGLKIGDGSLFGAVVDNTAFINVQAVGSKDVVRFGLIPTEVTGANGTSDNSDTSTGDNKKKYIVDRGTNNYVHGGKKDDTLVAGAGDSVWGAGGNDIIMLDRTQGTTEKVGVINNSGKDSVSGFESGYDSGDMVYFYENSVLEGSITVNKNDKVEIGLGGSKVVLTDVALDENGAAYIVAQDKDWHGTAENDDTVIRVAVGKGSSLSTLSSNNGEWANIYVNGAVDFSERDTGVRVDLSNNSANGDMNAFLGLTPYLYTFGVDSVKGSDNGDNVLIGNGKKNTLVGGAGVRNSLWGGNAATNDVLVGNADSTDEFFFMQNNGNDTIQNAGADDKVVFYGVKFEGSGCKFENGVASFVNGQKLTFDGTIENGFKAQFTDATFTYNNGNWERQ
jgi:hypothetical protein